MSRILHKYGANVEAAANGIVGAEMVKRSNPFYYNAVLMDVKMTGLDGFGAARRIRNLGDPDLAGVPIIAVGVDAYSVDREKLHAVGIDAYITKPVKESELVRKLQDVSL
jgi:CheY-like chemotaxis protein